MSGAARIDAEAVAAAVPAALTRLVRETTRALARCVREDGVLIDRGSGAPTAPDHYGASFAALALASADAEDPRWHALLARWRPQRPSARGHGPFNRLALLLLAERLAPRCGERRVYDALASGPAARTLAARRRDAAQVFGRLRRHPSNNWLLLEHACDVLESAWSAPGARREEALRAAGAVFDADCARWLTPAGGFFDYPARRRGAPLAAPLCYHAKFAAVLALVVRAAPSRERELRLTAATRWLTAFLDERSGHFGGYGRSGHALFGSACALFVCLDALARSGGRTQRAGHAQHIDALCAELEAGRRDDGLLSLTPSGVLGAQGGWDRYMHLSVYNAWAAGLLGWLCTRITDSVAPAPVTGPPNAAADGPGDAVFLDPEADVAACRGARASVFLSLRGGVVQDFDADEVDLRSAGLQPFHLSEAGRAALAAPLRVARSALRACPQLAGFTPVFRVAEALYGLVRFDAVELHADAGGQLLALGWGVPVRLHDDPARRRGLRRWIDALDTRLCASRLRRRRALAPPRLAGHAALRVFAFDGASGRCALATLLRGCVSPALWLNPLGHARLAGASPAAVARGCRDGEPVATGRSGPLPGPLPGVLGACAEASAWPTRDTVWTLELAPGAESASRAAPPEALLKIDLAGGLAITPWRTLPLPPRRR